MVGLYPQYCAARLLLTFCRDPGRAAREKMRLVRNVSSGIFLYHALHRLSQVSAGSPLLESCVEAVPR